jgi:predicted negative regulator of RcsB-dependent stress response
VADHLNDEERLDAVKKWWQRNGATLVVVVVLTLGGWYGWQYWQGTRQNQAEESSYVYMAMLDALTLWEQDASEENTTRTVAHAETLKKLGKNSLYAVYGAMTVAKLAVAEGDYANAAAELQWALEDTDDAAMQALIRLRLAKVEFARDNSQQALDLLNQTPPESFAALYEELKGDIFAAQGKRESAGNAYKMALEKLNDSDARAQALLELKLNEVMPEAEKTAAGEDEA